MAERKTTVTSASVDDFIDSLDSEQVRDDCRTLVSLMRKATRARPEMWGTTIIGFGRYQWRSASGKPVEWMITAFAPRKANLTVYLWPQFDGRDELLARLGKHSCGKGCVYIKRLADVDLPTLQKLIAASVRHARTHPQMGTGSQEPTAGAKSLRAWQSRQRLPGLDDLRQVGVSIGPQLDEPFELLAGASAVSSSLQQTGERENVAWFQRRS